MTEGVLRESLNGDDLEQYSCIVMDEAREEEEEEEEEGNKTALSEAVWSMHYRPS